MAKPKSGQKKFNLKYGKLGKNLDILNGAEKKQGPGNIKRSQPRKKAVAIKDADQGSKMPLVIASGQGTLADQILQIAWANNVKVREDADLVEVLSAIDTDSEIPIEAFAAVAEILAYVYRVNSGEIPLDKIKENQ